MGFARSFGEFDETKVQPGLLYRATRPIRATSAQGEVERLKGGFARRRRGPRPRS
jgi:hypothetical protein